MGGSRATLAGTESPLRLRTLARRTGAQPERRVSAVSNAGRHVAAESFADDAAQERYAERITQYLAKRPCARRSSTHPGQVLLRTTRTPCLISCVTCWTRRRRPFPSGAGDVRREDCRRGFRQQPGAGRAQGDRAGRTRFLPRLRALGLQPGRSRQPSAGRLRSAAQFARRPQAAIRRRSIGRCSNLSSQDWPDPRIKLFVTWRLLEARRRFPNCLRRRIRAAHRELAIGPSICLPLLGGMRDNGP